MSEPAPHFVVYLLHFDPPVGTARHYIGSSIATNLQRRLSEHASGRGSRLTAYAFKHHHRVRLVNLFPAYTRRLEQLLKQAGHYSRHCPICNPGIETPELKQPQELPCRSTDLTAWTSRSWH